ncbi:MAG: hypothetical protein WBW93_13935 [Steroidobacteraceae bacterium]
MHRLSPYDGAGTPFDWQESIGFGREPFASLTCGPYAPTAGPQGLAIGTFCWYDPDTGIATNVQSAGFLGFVLPLANRYNLWERVYTQYPMDGVPPFPQQIIRPGIACVLAVSGVFAPKFPNGGGAGSQVFTDPATGLPYAGNTTGTYVATPWTLLQSGGVGARLRMSTFVQPFN